MRILSRLALAALAGGLIISPAAAQARSAPEPAATAAFERAEAMTSAGATTPTSGSPPAGGGGGSNPHEWLMVATLIGVAGIGATGFALLRVQGDG